VGPAAGEDDRYFALANTLRDSILAGVSWAEGDQSECHNGALRLFSTSEDSVARKSLADMLKHLEKIVLVRGIGTPLDTAPVTALLRTVVGWEGGVSRPKWDVAAGEKPPEAIATGLTGSFMNPNTGKCELLVPFDTMRIVLPEGAELAPRESDVATVQVVTGTEGLDELRSSFFAAHHEKGAALAYIRIIALVPWRDYAVVAVNRPVEFNGVLLSMSDAGGAAYLFHRVGQEWRLLSITRTWR
jgi:hypothetical protein